MAGIFINANYFHHAEDESLNWTSKFQTEANKSCKFMQEPIKWLMVLCTNLVCR